MKKRDKRKHPNGWTFTQHGSSGKWDADLTRYPCKYRDDFLCGFCNGSDGRKKQCDRYSDMVKNEDKTTQFILHGDEPGSAAREPEPWGRGAGMGISTQLRDWLKKEATKGQIVDEVEPAPVSAFDTQVGGNHYKQYAIQPYEFFYHNNIPHHKAAIIRRILRYDHPTGKGVEDLQKIKHEVDLIIELMGAAKNDR